MFLSWLKATVYELTSSKGLKSYLPLSIFTSLGSTITNSLSDQLAILHLSIESHYLFNFYGN